MSRDLAHVLSAVFTEPWMIDPRKGKILAEVVVRRASGHRLTAVDIEAAAGEERAKVNARLVDADRVNAARVGVGVVPVLGVLVHRGQLDNSSGMTSTELLSAKFRALVDDPNVGTIVLDIDSPGGEVAGIEELAAEIRASPKPVVAIANSMAASAAYHIAAAADELVVTPSGEVGSVGVLIVHMDDSKALEQEGITRTIVAAGEHKGELWGPLTEEARAYLESQARDVYQGFVSNLAEFRGVTPSKVRETFGGGRMVRAEDAKSRGMVDRVASFRETLDRLVAGGRVRRRRAQAAAADIHERERFALDLD